MKGGIAMEKQTKNDNACSNRLAAYTKSLMDYGKKK